MLNAAVQTDEWAGMRLRLNKFVPLFILLKTFDIRLMVLPFPTSNMINVTKMYVFHRYRLRPNLYSRNAI